MSKYQEAGEKYCKDTLEFIIKGEENTLWYRGDAVYKKIDEYNHKIAEVVKQALDENIFFTEISDCDYGSVNMKGILEIAQKSGNFAELGKHDEEAIFNIGLSMIRNRMKLAKEKYNEREYPEHARKLEEIRKAELEVYGGGSYQCQKVHEEMDKFDEYAKNYEDIYKNLSEQDKKQLQSKQEERNFDNKAKNLEAIEQGNIIALRDSRDGLETTYYQKNLKGELAPISAEKAHGILLKDKVLGKDISERKLLRKYYENGLMAIKVNESHIECMNIMPGKEQVGISKEDFEKQRLSAQSIKNVDRQLDHSEVVECSGIIKIYVPNEIGKKGEIHHYQKNSKGELQEISEEQANKIIAADPNKKAKQVPMINLGHGKIALKDGDEVISADVNKLRRDYNNMNKVVPNKDNVR